MQGSVFLIKKTGFEPRALGKAPGALCHPRRLAHRREIPSGVPRRSKLCIACSDLFYKSERAHAAAPPFQIEPTALGFDLVFFSLDIRVLYRRSCQKTFPCCAGERFLYTRKELLQNEGFCGRLFFIVATLSSYFVRMSCDRGQLLALGF